MTELQAAVMLAQLRKFDRLKAHCRQMQDKIVSGIRDLPGIQMRRIPDPTGDTALEIYIVMPTVEKADQLRAQARRPECQLPQDHRQLLPLQPLRVLHHRAQHIRPELPHSRNSKTGPPRATARKISP